MVMMVMMMNMMNMLTSASAIPASCSLSFHILLTFHLHLLPSLSHYTLIIIITIATDSLQLSCPTPEPSEIVKASVFEDYVTQCLSHIINTHPSHSLSGREVGVVLQRLQVPIPKMSSSHGTSLYNDPYGGKQFKDVLMVVKERYASVKAFLYR